MCNRFSLKLILKTFGILAISTSAVKRTLLPYFIFGGWGDNRLKMGGSLDLDDRYAHIYFSFTDVFLHLFL